MENKKNKSKESKKDYFKRFLDLNVFSYTKPNDKKLFIGSDPSEVYSLFNGNANTVKKNIDGTPNTIDVSTLNVDQQALQAYVILARQTFYNEYFVPLKEQIKDSKKKNDDRFDFVVTNLQAHANQINSLSPSSVSEVSTDQSQVLNSSQIVTKKTKKKKTSDS